MKKEILDRIKLHRVSAIIRTNSAETATRAMEAAVAGGFRMVEFTLNTPGAMELIAAFSRNPDLLVGAGTVMTPGLAREAVAAGARFIVSPVVDPEVIETASSLNVVSVPGTATPTEMVEAHRAGADVIKIFPAPSDLAAFVTQVRGPLPELRLFPTAGITPDNFVPVLRAGAFGAGFVAPLFPPAELAAGEFGKIEERARKILRDLADADLG